MTPGNAREARRKAAKAAAGLVRVEVWVPEAEAWQIRTLAENLCLDAQEQKQGA